MILPNAVLRITCSTAAPDFGYGQNAVFLRLARKCQSPIMRQSVRNLPVNGKYAAAIFSKFNKSIAIGRPGFYQSASHRKI
ncbi:hypothetical protein [Ligilactobacillus ruminis]|uniref:hypothetical protein n=1 Tax=Ligilactobacillus ruminis TaxID=1623 RepID=UPI003F972355